MVKCDKCGAEVDLPETLFGLPVVVTECKKCEGPPTVMDWYEHWIDIGGEG